MIINNRLKGLVELDDLLRKAERDAAMHDTPEAHARHAVQQLRSGRPAHEVLKPHIDAFDKADHEHMRSIDAGLTGPGSGAERDRLSQAAKHASDRLHTVGRAIGHEPGKFMGLKLRGAGWTHESPESHLDRLTRAYRGGSSSLPDGSGRTHTTFGSHEDAHGFVSSLHHHRPHALSHYEPPNENSNHHTVSWTHRHGPDERRVCPTCVPH